MPSGLVRACRLSEHQYNIGTYSRYLGTSEQYKGGVGRWDGPNVDAGAMTTLEEPLHVPAEGGWKSGHSLVGSRWSRREWDSESASPCYRPTLIRSLRLSYSLSLRFGPSPAHAICEFCHRFSPMRFDSRQFWTPDSLKFRGESRTSPLLAGWPFPGVAALGKCWTRPYSSRCERHGHIKRPRKCKEAEQCPGRFN